MFLHHLKNFSPYSGHIYNEMRSGIVRKHGELISKNENRFKLIERIGYFRSESCVETTKLIL